MIGGMAGGWFEDPRQCRTRDWVLTKQAGPKARLGRRWGWGRVHVEPWSKDLEALENRLWVRLGQSDYSLGYNSRLQGWKAARSRWPRAPPLRHWV
jgi:hypothetical protein